MTRRRWDIPSPPAHSGRARPSPAGLADETAAVVPTAVQQSGGSIMFGRILARFRGPAVLGTILLLAAPAWAQSRNGKDDRPGGANGKAQAGTTSQAVQQTTPKTTNAAAATAQRRGDGEAAGRVSGTVDRNWAVNGPYMPYAGAAYYGYAYPNTYTSSAF